MDGVSEGGLSEEVEGGEEAEENEEHSEYVGSAFSM